MHIVSNYTSWLGIELLLVIVVILGCHMKIKTKKIIKIHLQLSLEMKRLDFEVAVDKKGRWNMAERRRTAVRLHGCMAGLVALLSNKTISMFKLRLLEWSGSAWEINQSPLSCLVAPHTFGFSSSLFVSQWSVTFLIQAFASSSLTIDVFPEVIKLCAILFLLNP